MKEKKQKSKSKNPEEPMISGHDLDFIKQEHEEGLGLLSSEVLADLIMNEKDDDGKLTETGRCAFEELYRRDPNYGR